MSILDLENSLDWDHPRPVKFREPYTLAVQLTVSRESRRQWGQVNTHTPVGAHLCVGDGLVTTDGAVSTLSWRKEMEIPFVFTDR